MGRFCKFCEISSLLLLFTVIIVHLYITIFYGTMALKLTKTAGNLDTGADCIEKNAEGKLPFRPAELTKRGHQTMRITEKNAKRTRHSSPSTSTTKGTTETIDGNDGIVGYYDHEIIDDSPCSFTDDGVTVLKKSSRILMTVVPVLVIKRYFPVPSWTTFPWDV